MSVPKEFIEVFENNKYHKIKETQQSITYKLHCYSEDKLNMLLSILDKNNISYELDRGEFWTHENKELYFIEIIISFMTFFDVI